MKKRWIFILRKLVNRFFAGTFQSKKTGAGGIEFAAYKDYQPDDTPRSISYPQSLKKCRWVVRVNIIEKGMICLFLIDRSASVNFGSSGISKKEIQDSLLDILAPAIVRNSNQVGFIIFTDRIEKYFEPRFGEKFTDERLKFIFAYKPESKLTNLDAVFRDILRMNLRADLLFVISDFYTAVDFRNSLKLLANKYDLIPMLLKDPRETTTFPKIKGGMFYFRDLETGELLWGDAPQKISNKALFEELGLDYILLKTDATEQEWEEKLRILFDQRKKRRRIR
jgi:uncharacterized protein (DUF58 family)